MPSLPTHRTAQRGPSAGRGPAQLTERGAVAVLLVALAVGLSGCGIVARSRSLFGGKVPVAVSISPQMNQNSPVAVEFVVVYKKPLLEKLLELPASQWFDRREQLLRDHPDGLDAWAWEWVPGQRVDVIDLDFRVGAKGGVIYADYFAPGNHRATFEPHKSIRVTLEDNGFSVEPQG